MAKMGRPCKPSALKRLAGNPGHRPLPKDEPMPNIPKRVPEPPCYLLKEAKEEWDRLAPELLRIGLLTMVDLTAFAAYCQCYARWVQAERLVNRKGITVKSDKGGIKANPAVNISKKYLTEMKAYLGKFGMTPSDRVRLSTPEPLQENKEQVEDELERLRSRKRNLRAVK